MQAKVYFRTLEVTQITETEKWGFNEILTGLGGVLSLFLGISFVAAFEYLELFIRLIVAMTTTLTTRRRGARGKTKAQIQNES